MNLSSPVVISEGILVKRKYMCLFERPLNDTRKKKNIISFFGISGERRFPVSDRCWRLLLTAERVKLKTAEFKDIVSVGVRTQGQANSFESPALNLQLSLNFLKELHPAY